MLRFSTHRQGSKGPIKRGGALSLFLEREGFACVLWLDIDSALSCYCYVR